MRRRIQIEVCCRRVVDLAVKNDEPVAVLQIRNSWDRILLQQLSHTLFISHRDRGERHTSFSQLPDLRNRSSAEHLNCYATILLKINRVGHVVAVESPLMALFIRHWAPLIHVRKRSQPPTGADEILGSGSIERRQR